MADSENNLQPSKKRGAGVQLTRDNSGLDDDEDTPIQETGTFKKASDEVLATRRIVKVRRHQTSSTTSAPAPTSASNPFAGIRLTPSVTSTNPVESEASKVTGKEPEQVNNNDGKSEDKVDDPKVESAAEEKIDANDVNVVQPGTENTTPSTEKNESNERTETDVSNEEQTDATATVEAVKDQNSEDGAQKPTEADDTGGVKDLGGKGNDKEKNNGEESTEKVGETVPVSSFGQLSSTQNAFSGLSGDGFPSTPFAFGSLPKEGGSSSGSASSSFFGLKTDQPTFGFGASNNGSSSIFGANIFTKSEGSKSTPPMQEVPVETGEENESTVFTADSILFEFVDGSWKERGKGELKVNVPSTGTGHSRLVMRTKGNLRLILNANLFPDMKLTGMDKKGITFACVNSASEGKQGLSTIALKFRDASIVEDFRATVVKHKEKTNVTLKTPESSPKASEV